MNTKRPLLFLLACFVVAVLYFYKPGRKPASAIGLSPDRSFALVSEIPTDCPMQCLARIRTHITALCTLAQDLVQARVDLSTLRA